jgi:hypothetical protein
MPHRPKERFAVPSLQVLLPRSLPFTIGPPHGDICRSAIVLADVRVELT